MLDKIYPNRPHVLLFKSYDWLKFDLRSALRRKLGHRVKLIRGPSDWRERADQWDGQDRLKQLVTIENYREIAFNGLRLWELCKSIVVDRINFPIVRDKSDLDVLRRIYQAAVQLMPEAEALIQRHRPTHVILEQGLQMDMRVMGEIARRYGIKTIAVENSFLHDYFIMDDGSGQITNRTTASRIAWDRIRARHLESQQRQSVREKLLTAETTFKHNDADDRQFRMDHGLPEGKKLILLLGQVAVDAAVAMDSPIWEDQFEFMVDTSRIFEAIADEYHLVIRLHPKEADGCTHLGEVNGQRLGNQTYERLKEAGINKRPHVTVFQGRDINTYALMRECTAGLCLTSQSGLEMLVRNRPVMVCGDAFFARKGFTWEVQAKEQLEPTLLAMIHQPELTEIQQHHRDVFLDYFIHEFLWPNNLEHCEQRLKQLFDL